MLIFKVLRTSGLIKEISTNSVNIQKLNGWTGDSNLHPLDCGSIALSIEIFLILKNFFSLVSHSYFGEYAGVTQRKADELLKLCKPKRKTKFKNCFHSLLKKFLKE